MRRKVLFAIVAALMLSFGMMVADRDGSAAGVTGRKISASAFAKPVGPALPFTLLGYEGDKAVLQLKLPKVGLVFRAEITRDGGMFLTVRDRVKSHFFAIPLPEGTVRATGGLPLFPNLDARVLSVRRDGSIVYGLYLNGDLVGIAVVRDGQLVELRRF